MEKVILAALEIADHEVRLLIGEFFNTRLNIMKVERVEIVKEPSLAFVFKPTTEAIRKAIVNASRNLGVVIERVLLMVPSQKIEVVKDRFDLLVNGTLEDDIYERLYNEAFAHARRNGQVIVNVLIKKIYINGVLSRKSLIGELCDTLSIETEVYLSEQELVYEHVRAVESVGCSVIDIGLDALCLGDEAGLFDLSMDSPVIAMRMERNSTYLSLYHRGSLLSAQWIQQGSIDWIMELCRTYQISVSTAARLLYYNIDVTKAADNNVPIYLWNHDNATQTLTYDELSGLLNPKIMRHLEALKEICDPILQQDNIHLVLSGEASLIDGLDKALHRSTGQSVTVYCPDTFGVRDRSLSALLGMFYLYKDLKMYRRTTLSSVDNNEFRRIISLQYKDSTSDESMTKRLKNFFFDRDNMKEDL